MIGMELDLIINIFIVHACSHSFNDIHSHGMAVILLI